MPAAPVMPLLASAENVPVPSPSRLTPSLALLVESTSSNASVAPLCRRTSTAGPPVALTFAVPAAATVTVPTFESPNAAVAPDVVVSARSVPTPSPNVVVPVVFVMLTPPLPEPVTVIESNVLLPMLVPPTPPVATRPAALPLVIEIVPATRSSRCRRC